MKATAPTIAEPQAAVKVGLGAFLELAKARLSALVLLTTLAGFYLGTQGAPDYLLMLHTLAGTGLLAAGAAALNQLLEKEHDARMLRTEDRPLPSGRLQPETALVFGALCAVGGFSYLAIAVNLLTSVLGIVTLVSYVAIYTPLKRRTAWNTIVGAVPGAMPPLMGWTAARGELDGAGWSLFAILFLWQLPHFLAIAWIYREQYASAGFAMLPVKDHGGRQTAVVTIGFVLALLAVTASPYLLGLTRGAYLVTAAILGAAFLAVAVHFARRRTHIAGRQLFLMSIVYLPLLLGAMILDKAS